MAIIGLITDFGIQDEYVGLMKAVILGIDPAAVPVDLSHAVEPQNVVQAAFLLEASYRYFPPGSIHLIVVDPGVGTERAVLYLEAHQQRFIAPDNGVLSLLMDPQGAVSLRRVDHAALWHPRVSPTFHGRDIMAPAVAHLSKGMDAREIGPELNPAAVKVLDDLRARHSSDGGIQGRIVHIDRFGNLITNIDLALLQFSEAFSPDRPLAIHVGRQLIVGVCRTYGDVETGRPLALIGSRGYLEIAVRCGNAQRYFGVRQGDTLEVRPVG
jgi:S-adenosyl-L-methionine hydrolase (adenosine-forming)